jgi:hypothetical protein
VLRSPAGLQQRQKYVPGRTLGYRELAAESKLVGTKFDDNAPAGPMALSVGSPFRTADTDTARLRIRMTRDGKDEWTFYLQMALTFSDGSIQRFSWPGLSLDNAAPECTLAERIVSETSHRVRATALTANCEFMDGSSPRNRRTTHNTSRRR